MLTKVIHVSGPHNRRRVAAHRDTPTVESEVSRARGRTGQINLTRSGYLGVAMRLFLAAYVQRAWGLDDVDMSQRQLAEWLTSVGFETKVSAVKNGTHTLLHAQSVPRTPEVAAFLELVKRRFPSFQAERLFAPS